MAESKASLLAEGKSHSQAIEPKGFLINDIEFNFDQEDEETNVEVGEEEEEEVKNWSPSVNTDQLAAVNFRQPTVLNGNNGSQLKTAAGQVVVQVFANRSSSEEEDDEHDGYDEPHPIEKR